MHTVVFALKSPRAYTDFDRTLYSHTLHHQCGFCTIPTICSKSQGHIGLILFWCWNGNFHMLRQFFFQTTCIKFLADHPAMLGLPTRPANYITLFHLHLHNDRHYSVILRVIFSITGMILLILAEKYLIFREFYPSPKILKVKL